MKVQRQMHFTWGGKARGKNLPNQRVWEFVKIRNSNCFGDFPKVLGMMEQVKDTLIRPNLMPPA